jgi:hypothetical protein
MFFFKASKYKTLAPYRPRKPWRPLLSDPAQHVLRKYPKFYVEILSEPNTPTQAQRRDSAIERTITPLTSRLAAVPSRPLQRV